MTAPDTHTLLTDKLREHWGYDSFLPLQREAMAAVLEGRDSLVVLPTGGGKSLCFQVPALCLPGVAVVVSPLLSLMKDQVDALRGNGVAAACLNSMQSGQERGQVIGQLRRGELDLIYVAPERLVTDHLFQLLGEVEVAFFAVDEAHCVSTWGHDFRPHYRELGSLKQRFPGTAVHGYTATATERVRADVIEQLRLAEPEVLIGGFDRPNLAYRVLRRDGVLDQVRSVIERHRDGSGIVYAISRKEVDRLSAKLNELGFSALPYHAGLSDGERQTNQEAFVEDRVRTIVATVAFGMGIDKPDVRYVVHAGMPKSLENYQQESGRAGRDGLDAECALFYSGSDAHVWQRMLQDSPRESQAGALASLRAMLDYCSGAVCRHRALVRHFGQDLDEDCGSRCDVCDGAVEWVEDALVVGQKILSSVIRQDQRFGAEYTALVLKGSKDQRIVQNRHDQLTTHGLLSDASKRGILDWIGQLVNQGFLERTGEFNVLRVTAAGGELLRGEATPRLTKPAKERGKTTKADRRAASWEGVDRGLFELLRELRTELARAAGIPPYMVFGDAALLAMARHRPSDETGFLAMRGVGRKKCEDYGERFLACITAYCAEHGVAADVDLPGAAPSSAAAAKTATAAPRERGADLAYPLFEQGRSVPDVAREIGRALSTVRVYLQDFIRERRLDDPTPWVDAEVTTRIEKAIDEVGPAPLKPIFEALGGDVDYERIAVVAACRKNRDAEASA